MNEDDTFRILQRIPKSEMTSRYYTWLFNIDGPAQGIDELFEEQGWTYDEWTQYR